MVRSVVGKPVQMCPPATGDITKPLPAEDGGGVWLRFHARTKWSAQGSRIAQSARAQAIGVRCRHRCRGSAR